jgi:hypothetical protein
MSYDSRNVVNRFLQLNRLNSSMNYLPPIISPYQILPPSIIQNNRIRLESERIKEIPILPRTSSMGTELLNDLITRQEEFLKRIRKHPQKYTMNNLDHQIESER